MRQILLFTVLVFHVVFAYGADYSYSYTDNCKKAYRSYLALHLDEGRGYLTAAIKEDPYNLTATYIADYEDCMLLLFNGDPNDYAQRKDHMVMRLALLNKGDSRSPWSRLFKAGIHLHWALVHIRFGENFKAATTFRKSFLLLKENKKLFPSFAYNDLFFGLEEAVVGTVPGEYKWIASIFGLQGDVKKGLSKIETFIRSHAEGDLFRDEALIYHCYLGFYLSGEQQKVWKFINTSQFSSPDNLMRLFVKANIALNYRKADVALNVLESVKKNKSYHHFPIMEYEMGNALYYTLDMDAVAYYRKFLSKYRGKLFVKDTYHNLALLYYMQNDMQNANLYRNRILKAGTTMVDADKQAQRFASETTWPNKTLLAVRLLIDGGYYKQALARLANLNEGSFAEVVEKLEYNFRKGRVHDELDEDATAIVYYKRALEIGKTRKEHFAARSVLQMAFIYEKEGRYEEAKSMYRLCLEMRGHDFQNSIDQQSKAGLSRLMSK